MAAANTLAVVDTGLQISLNYIVKFNVKPTPNSSRDYLGGDGGLLGATRLSPRLRYSLLVFSDNWPGLCKAGRGPFRGRICKVRPAFRNAGRTFALSGKFQYSDQMSGLRFSSKLG